jgi:hypothetical protein
VVFGKVDHQILLLVVGDQADRGAGYRHRLPSFTPVEITVTDSQVNRERLFSTARAPCDGGAPAQPGLMFKNQLGRA